MDRVYISRTALCWYYQGEDKGAEHRTHRQENGRERVGMRCHSYPAAESWEHSHFAVTEWKTLVQVLYSVGDWCIKDWWRQCCSQEKLLFFFRLHWNRKNICTNAKGKMRVICRASQGVRACELFKQNLVSGITGSGYNLWLVNPVLTVPNNTQALLYWWECDLLATARCLSKNVG